MADSKVTDLQSATSVNTTDVAYLVQGSTDKKISVSTFLANLPNTPTRLKGTLSLAGTVQSLVGEGTIETTQNITLLTNSADCTINIADGTYDGQIKIVIATAVLGTSTLSSNLGVSQIAFSAVGHSVTLIWLSGNWWPIGGTAVITT